MAILLHKGSLTPGERRVFEELKEHGCAVCEIDKRGHNWTWKINGRPVTGPLYRLATKGKVEIEAPAPGAKAFLKPV